MLIYFSVSNPKKTEVEKFPALPTSTLAPSPTTIPISPTSKPLSFSEMNTLYGPCVSASVLMYHHVQSKESAQKEGSGALTVYTDVFRGQMEYLRDHGYSVVSMVELASFFDKNSSLPSKSIILTFDDGYDDFASDTFPILRELSFKATVFVPSGLIENPGYLSWSQLSEISGSGLVLFANHTWSHKNVKSDRSEVEKEINLADLQLNDKGYNNPKVFSYPYGISSSLAEEFLGKKGYSLAFKTKFGRILCQKTRFELPRVRIGNATLNQYGF